MAAQESHPDAVTDLPPRFHPGADDINGPDYLVTGNHWGRRVWTLSLHGQNIAVAYPARGRPDPHVPGGGVVQFAVDEGEFAMSSDLICPIRVHVSMPSAPAASRHKYVDHKYGYSPAGVALSSSMASRS
ncbi:hypothetical protein MPRF_42770 [Mycolicibacterium parafortuitum]|uniref:Uncharacterized protein n=1 Tax=Mycolicibacterium parafortuitum TaxID=39692 RepID=A0A7I7U7Q6_MYCPF|nr:hypothetical protein MPRF_42770 [Mycolicibacterium parafortuitum]